MKSDPLRRIAALNLTAEQMREVLSVIADVEAEHEAIATQVEARKAKDRARKSNGKSKKIPRSVQGNSMEIPVEEKCALSSSLLTSEIQEEKKEERKKEKARAKICPVDFQPTESHFALGVELGMTPVQVRSAATEMIEWSHANSGRAVAKKSDWNLALNSWMRRNKPNGQGRPRAFQNDELSVSKAADRLGERIEREGIVAFAPRPSLVQRESQDDLLLLPPGRSARP